MVSTIEMGQRDSTAQRRVAMPKQHEENIHVGIMGTNFLENLHFQKL
jgi:hypothetical protein